MKSVTIDVGTIAYKELNENIRQQLQGADEVVLNNVFGQKYIGAGLANGKAIKIYGTPGNDLAVYMDGGHIEIFGNAQDAIGNTMNGGTIIVHGNAGDAVGYAMRDGEIYIQGDVGYRSGIHMKEFGDAKPVIVVGGKAGSYLAEYMAGGIIIVLGIGTQGESVGEYLATGMHGGEIYIRGNVESYKILKGIKCEKCAESDKEKISKYIKKYCRYFNCGEAELLQDSYIKLSPVSARPFKDVFTKL